MKTEYINPELLAKKIMRAFLLSLFFFASVSQAQNTEFTVGTADIIDLTDHTGATSWNIGDDAVSSAISLGFSFDFYGETFTSGKGATNGCFTFNTTYNYVCSDFTPDPLPKTNFDMTIFPFWTDLIRDSGSSMFYKTFGDAGDTDQYFVLGWYNMREFNQSGTDNSFELLLYETTNLIEFRYDKIDIDAHDVIIGVQGHATDSSHAMYNANEYKLYLHHNECASGTLHDSYDINCINTNFNATSYKTTLLGNSLSITVEDQYGCASNALLASTCSGYAVAYFNQQCNVSSLYNSECNGYAAAYLTQQCDITSLYSSECSGYVVAYLNQQCGLDTLYDRDCLGYDDAFYDRECTQNSQYDTGCAGYIFETVYYYDDSSTGYYEDDYSYVNEFDYGYEDEYWIDDDPYADMYFTDVEWYEIDIQEFGQEQVDVWYGSDVSFNNEGTIVWDDSVLESWDELDTEMDIYDQLVESYDEIYEEPYVETYTDFDIVFAYEEYTDIVEYISVVNAVEIIDVIFDADELIDEYELETIHSEAFEEEVEEEITEEEVVEELEEELIEEELKEELIEDEEFDEEAEEELDAEDKPTAKKRTKKKISKGKQSMLDAMAKATGTQNTAVGNTTGDNNTAVGNDSTISSDNSVNTMFASNTTDANNTAIGNTIGTQNTAIGSTSTSTMQSGGNSSSSGGVSSPVLSAVASAASGSSMSTSNSPSISDQIASSAVQTNTILSLSGSTGAVSNVSVMVTPMPSLSASPTVAMAEVQVQNMQGEIDTAMSGMMTTSEADKIADDIVAANIKEQQEEIEQQQSTTGEYADASTLIAYMGYVAGFNAYTQKTMPQAATWYQPKSIYANVSIPDNNSAFMNMYSGNLNGIRNMIGLQPNL